MSRGNAKRPRPAVANASPIQNGVREPKWHLTKELGLSFVTCHARDYDIVEPIFLAFMIKPRAIKQEKYIIRSFRYFRQQNTSIS